MHFVFYIKQPQTYKKYKLVKKKWIDCLEKRYKIPSKIKVNTF